MTTSFSQEAGETRPLSMRCWRSYTAATSTLSCSRSTSPAVRWSSLGLLWREIRLHTCLMMLLVTMAPSACALRSSAVGQTGRLRMTRRLRTTGRTMIVQRTMKTPKLAVRHYDSVCIICCWLHHSQSLSQSPALSFRRRSGTACWTARTGKWFPVSIALPSSWNSAN